MQHPFEQLAYHRSRTPQERQERPHTVHASSAINFAAIEEEDDDVISDNDRTPRASNAGPPSLSYGHATRRLSRDDTANDIHILAAQAAAASPANKACAAPQEDRYHNIVADDPRSAQLHNRRTPRRTNHRVPTHTSSIPPDSSDTYQHNETLKSATYIGRKFSNRYRERVHDLKESMSRYQMPQFSGRGRRSSTPHRLEFPPDPMVLDESSSTHPSRLPTSPSKRSARVADDRPRKFRPTLFPNSDRKDTPAPSAIGGGLPLRSASIRQAPAILSAPGGDSARKAAALYNNNAFPPSWEQGLWAMPDDDDLHARRGRLGSLSSAADSGADLSTYSGSNASFHDRDGDIDMAGNQSLPYPHLPTMDLTQRLPDEITLQIFENLDAQDLARAECVTQRWQSLANNTSVWRAAFLRRYQRRIETDPAPVQVGGEGIGLPTKFNQQWRKMYKARVQLEQNWRAGAQNAGKAVYLSGHTDSVYCLQFDEEKIITGSRDRTIRVWDINTYSCLRVIGGPNVRPVLGPKVLRTVDYPSFHMATASVNGTAYGESIYHVPSDWHDASILCLQYDEEILVTGSSDSDLLVWDIKTYEPIRRLRRHNGGVLDVALDAKHIVSCSKDSRIIVWDRQTYQPKGELTGHRGPVNAVQLRGRYLVSASGDGIARLWDLNEMKLKKEFSAKERGLAAVEFSEDMKYVLAGGNDNITYKFETETGREVMQFTGHSQLVRSLWLDSANNRVVSGSYDLDLRVYDFTTGQELWRGEEWTTSWMLAAKSDYRRIVATSQDGRILIVDFGIWKGAPTYISRDGMSIDNINALRGIEDTNEIRFRNPFDRNRSIGT